MNKTIKSLLDRFFLTTIFCAICTLFFFAARALYECSTTTYYAQKVLVTSQGHVKRVLFSPDDDPQQVLLGLIDGEKAKISVAIFSFTNSSLAQALVNAKKRGVIVEIVADGSNSMAEFSKIPFLKTNKIPIWIYPSASRDKRCPKRDEKWPTAAGIMHDKFMIFKKSLLGHMVLWTGSYNFTRSANDRNQENVIVTDDPEIVPRYLKQFDILKARCVKT